MQNVSKDNVDSTLAGLDKPALLYFSAEWCGPCKSFKPLMDEISVARADEIDVLAIDVDDAQESAQEFGVQGIPNVVAYVDGKTVGRFVGRKPEEEVNNFINTTLLGQDSNE